MNSSNCQHIVFGRCQFATFFLHSIIITCLVNSITIMWTPNTRKPQSTSKTQFWPKSPSWWPPGKGMVGSQLESMLLTGDHRCIVGIGVKFIDSLIRYSEKKFSSNTILMFWTWEMTKEKAEISITSQLELTGEWLPWPSWAQSWAPPWGASPSSSSPRWPSSSSRSSSFLDNMAFPNFVRINVQKVWLFEIRVRMQLQIHFQKDKNLIKTKNLSPTLCQWRRRYPKLESHPPIGPLCLREQAKKAVTKRIQASRAFVNPIHFLRSIFVFYVRS